MPWEGNRMLSRLSSKKVLFQAGLKGIFAFTLFFVCCVGVAEALELTVSPTGSNNDQTIINNALEAVHNSGGGKVYLNAGTYEVCLLYTSDAADDLTRVDLGGRRIIK